MIVNLQLNQTDTNYCFDKRGRIPSQFLKDFTTRQYLKNCCCRSYGVVTFIYKLLHYIRN